MNFYLDLPQARWRNLVCGGDCRLLRSQEILKGALMPIGKSPYMFVYIQKQFPENFAYLILTILELFAREVCKFRLIFNIFYCF